MSSSNFIDTISRGNKFSLENEANLNIKKPKSIERVPAYLQSPRAWKNYSNQALYEAEIALRKWFKIKMEDENWVKNRFARRYKCSMLIEEIFGRPYDQKIDGKYTMIYSRLFAHYSSKVSKFYWNPKTQKTESLTAYNISIQRINKAKAYSIRLRVEDLIAEGKIPTVYNTRPVVDTKPGFVRKKQSRENTQRRSEKMREIYERNNSKR